MVFPHFHPHKGGVENYIANFSTQLRDRCGWDVSVVTTRPDIGSPQQEEVLGLRVFSLPRLATLSNTPVDHRWLGWIRQLIRTERPDVINAHVPVPVMCDVARSARGGTPFVLTYHNDLVKQGLAGTVAARAYQGAVLGRTLRMSDRIVVTSQTYVDQSPYLGRHRPKLRIVPPGVDTSVFHPGVSGRSFAERFGTRSPIVLFVGSLGPTHRHKGLDVLIPAVAKLRARFPEILLVVVGGGDHGRYAELVRRSGVDANVTFAGYVDDDELPSYFAGADLFCLPSLSTAEGFGMVLAESLACGTPVVASRVGGMPYVVETTGGGVLAEPGDVSSLTNAIADLLSAPERLSAMGQRGATEVARRFSWSSLTDDYDAVLREAVA